MEKLVYNGHIIKVTEEKIEDILWERAYLPNGVIIFPITDDGKVLFIKEKRPHENPPYRVKPVSGILEDDKGSPAENAMREMQEEIGYKSESMELLMKINSSGTINNHQYFFIARGLTPSKLPNPDGEDTILEVQAYGIDELFQKYMNDEMRWSVSTLGFLRLYYSLKGQVS